MRLSPRDYPRYLFKFEPIPKISDWQRLRGKMTLSFALHKSNKSEKEFAETYGYAESRLMEKWLSGETVLSRISAQKIDRLVPGTLEVFDFPMFPLLADKPMSEMRVRQLLNPYLATKDSGAPYLYWNFPSKLAKLQDKSFVPSLFERDTHALFQYNDIYSFNALLGVVRIADSAGDADFHYSAFMDLTRALPTMLKLPWIRQHAEMFINHINTIRSRLLFTIVMFDIDWDVIWQQVEDPLHQPKRELRPWDRATARFAEIEDPVLTAEVIPGTEVKRRALMREIRRIKKKLSATK